VEGAREVGERHRDGAQGAGAHVEAVLEAPHRARHEDALPAHAQAVADGLEHRPQRPARGASPEPREPDAQPRRLFDPPRDMQRKTIARHHVEADPRQQRHTRRLRLVVAPGEGLEDVDLAGDVEVVGSGCEAGIGHRA
jgi:hypothetical protein